MRRKFYWVMDGGDRAVPCYRHSRPVPRWVLLSAALGVAAAFFRGLLAGGR